MYFQQTETERYDKTVDLREKWLKLEPDNLQIKVNAQTPTNGKPIVKITDPPSLCFGVCHSAYEQDAARPVVADKE